MTLRNSVVPILDGSALFPQNFLSRPSAHGWGASISYNFNKYLGFVADFGRQSGQGQLVFCADFLFPPCPPTDLSMQQYLFGFRFTKRTERLAGFGHLLVGAAHTTSSGFSLSQDDPFFGPMVLTVPDTSKTRFAMGLGGGLDVSVHKRLSFRLLQFDWIPVAHGSVETGFIFVETGKPVKEILWWNNIRLASGIVLKFGAR